MNQRLLLCFSFFLLLACGKKVETTSPKREGITESVYASGLLKSKNQYQVFATVNGLLLKAYVDEGDTVKKGAPLFTILNEASRLNRENAQLATELSDYNSNQAKLDEMKLNIELLRNKMVNDSFLMVRQQNLWAQNVGSKIELENSELNYKTSRITYQSAVLRYNDEKRRLEIISKQARKNLKISQETESDFTIHSIMNGKVYLLLKEQGEMVNTQTPLAIVGDLKDFVLELQVDEYDITSIHVGQQVKVNMDSYKGEIFDAVITKVNPMMNERSKTVTVEAAFVTPPPSLYPNLTLEANIILQVKDDVLTLPRKFILEDRYVINTNGDTLTIKVGVKDYQKAEVLEGVKENDVLILPE